MTLANDFILIAGILFVASILATAITPRLGVPLLLIFLLVGMMAGEDGPGGIPFNNYPLANFAGTLALAVILFDGGLRTSAASFRTALWQAKLLATLGVLFTAAITGALAAWLLDLSWAEGLLIGAIVGSTDAAAVFALLHTSAVSLNARVTSTLEMESGTNDPMAIFLTLAVLQYLINPEQYLFTDSLILLLQQLGLGLAFGLAGGALLSKALNRIPLSDSLYPLLALSGALCIFGLASVTGGSGFLAVYLAGFWIGNRRVRALMNIRRFHDGVAWLAQIGMFVMLGLLVNPSELLSVAVPALLTALVLIGVARPVAVWLSLIGFRFPLREKIYISWVGLRGSVPIVLATFPWLAGLENAALYFNVAFFIVLVSLVIQGWTIAPMARLLGLHVPTTSARIHRVDIDLPGARDYEIVSYRLSRHSGLAGLTVKELPLRDNSRVVCVARDDKVLPYREWGQLREGDTLTLLTPQDEIPALDKVFEATRKPLKKTEQRFFGEFSVDPTASVAELATAYPVEPPPHALRLTIAEFLTSSLPKPVVCDRLRLGDLELVVRKVDGETITGVGLRLPH
jgi:potassium/hydrogen antiporter